MSYASSDYAYLKLIHISAVVLSFAGFTARGIGLWRGASWIRCRAARTLPHVVDTVLLLSALGMLWTIHLSPWSLAWLRAKIVGLLAYITLGMVALSPARARQPRKPRMVHVLSWGGALAVYAYIVTVAVTKNARGIFFWW